MTGAERLRRKLQKVREAVEAGAVRTVQGAAQETAERAKAFVPVDTGTLKGSIGASGAGLTATVAAEAEYAAAVELGTASREPQPFFTPAMQEQRAAIRGKAAANVREEITRRCGR